MSKVLQFDSEPSTTRSRVLKVTGKADSAVFSIEVGPDWSTLSPIQLTSGKRFSAILELTPGRNEFVFQPYSVSSTPLQAERFVINYRETEVETYHTGNSLDFHAEELGFSRLFGEKNVSLRERMMQAGLAVAQGDQGVPISMAAEMAKPFSHEMVRVSITRSTYNRPDITDVFVKVTPSQFKIAAKQLVNSDSPVRFDIGYPYYTPSSEVSPFGRVKLLTEAGEDLPSDAYDYDADTNRIWLRDFDYVDQDLLLVYNTVLSVDLSGDLAAFETAVELATDLEVTITATDYHTSTTDADWLVPTTWLPVSEQEDYPNNVNRTQPGAYLSVSETKSFPLHFHREDFLDSEGSGLGTKLEKYVKEVNSVDRRTWDKVIVGVDGLRDETFNPRYDAFPHLMDSHRGHWGADRYNIHEVQYLGTGVRDTSNQFRGVPLNRWQSGTGTEGDLEPGSSTVELVSYLDEPEVVEEESNPLYGIL